MNLVILDRDGVINEDSPEFIKSVDEWQPLPRSLDAIARLNQAGFRVVVATNQSGVARGLLSIETLAMIHAHMHTRLAAHGATVDAVFYCACAPDAGCDCRKPKPGMLHAISKRAGVALDNVPYIGDSMRDIDAARAAGARPILVRTGNGANTEAMLDPAHAVPVFDDLADAVAALVDEIQELSTPS